jgi:SAM-dependent methyltransferase
VTDSVGDRVHRYLLDGGDADLRRLLTISQVLAEPARTALRRSGIAPGWTALECGCGPLGALLQLAELTGEAGQVTGVDLNAAAVDRVLSTAGALALGNVSAFAGDIHDLGAGALGGPFDLAYTRLFLEWDRNTSERGHGAAARDRWGCAGLAGTAPLATVLLY